MIFRLSQELARKVKEPRLADMPMAEDALTDWSAGIFSAGRTRYILACNTRSLYSVILYARGINDMNDLLVNVLHSIRDTMEDDGLSLAYTQRIAPATGVVFAAKRLNRSITGSMNEMIADAKSGGLDDGTVSPFDAGAYLNGLLRSTLTGPRGMPYGKPRETMKSLFNASAPQANA